MAQHGAAHQTISKFSVLQEDRMFHDRRIQALLALSALAALLIPALAASDPLSDETLKSLLTRQPDHIANYTFHLTAGDVEARVAIRGSSVMSALLSDLLPDGGFRYYKLRDESGNLYGVSPLERTFTPLEERDKPAEPVLGTLYSGVTKLGGKIAAEIKGAGSIAGARTTKLELKIDAGPLSGKIAIESAPSLGNLVVNFQQKGSPGLAYSLAQISLDPPESLFVIPADYRRLDESATRRSRFEEGKPTVFGSIHPDFYKYGDDAVLPKGVEMAWMKIMRTDDKTLSEYAFVHSPGEIAVALRPGTYRITEIQLRDQVLSDNPVKLPTMGPEFVVPEQGCVDIGKITIEVIRLPAQDLEADIEVLKQIQKKVAKQIPGYQPVFLRLDRGSLIPSPGGVEPSDRRGEHNGCPSLPAKF